MNEGIAFEDFRSIIVGLANNGNCVFDYTDPVVSAVPDGTDYL